MYKHIEKDELQKQVDELKDENEKLRYLADECMRWRWKYGNMNAIGVDYEDLGKAQAEMDELKQELEKAYETERANIQAEIAEAGTSCHWCKQQAVKDTAKEILQKVKSYTLDKEVGMKYLIDRLAKEYSVEVD